MRSIEGRNRDEKLNTPRISSSISRSNIALSSSSFSNARSGSTVNSRSRVTCSLKSSLEVLLGSGSISAVWVSLLYVTRSWRPTVSRVLAAQERRHCTLCGNSNNSCWTSIRSGVNLGVMGLCHGVGIQPAGFANTDAPIHHILSRRLHKRRAKTRPIRTCAAYAAHPSGNTERSRPREIRVTKRRCSGDRRCRRQVRATRARATRHECIIRTQNRTQ